MRFVQFRIISCVLCALCVFCSVFFFLVLNSASVILVIIVLYKVKPSIIGTKYQNVTTIFSPIVVVFNWYILWIDVHLDVYIVARAN